MRLFVILLLAVSGSASAASFDCNKASTFVEKAICSDKTLGELDDALSSNYKSMLASNIGDGARKELRTTQRIWLADRNKCTTRSCVEALYRQRVDAICDYPVISGVHPGCTYSDDIE